MVKKNNTISFKVPSEKDKIDLKKELKKRNTGRGTYSDFEVMKAGILATAESHKKIDDGDCTILIPTIEEFRNRRKKLMNERDELINKVHQINELIRALNLKAKYYPDENIQEFEGIRRIYDEEGREYI